MSKLPFVKYSGLGNDFILFEKKSFLQSIEDHHRDLSQWISFLCHRRRSIGADGLILYEKISSDRFALDFFNSDGSFAALCGNGLRSAAHYFFAKSKNLQSIWIQTTHFLHQCYVEGDIVTCTMQTPKYHASYASQKDQGENLDDNQDWHLLECGVPHLIKVLDHSNNIRTILLEEIGASFQRRKELPIETVNVSILQLASLENTKPSVLIRTYERGVFKETEACGTAAMSAAALMTRLHPTKSDWVFHFSGFASQIIEDESIEVNLGSECKMKAKVEFVFEGTI